MSLNRRQIGFLVRFALLCIIFYIPIAIPAIERVTVTPFTRGLTVACGAILRAVGQDVVTSGTVRLIDPPVETSVPWSVIFRMSGGSCPIWLVEGVSAISIAI